MPNIRINNQEKLRALTTRNPMMTKERRVWYDIAIALVVMLSLIGIYRYIIGINNNITTVTSPVTEMRKTTPVEQYGFSNADYFFEESTLENNQFLGDILYKSGIPYPLIAELEQKAKDIYDVRRIRAGKKYAIVKEDSCGNTVALVYKPDPLSYVVYDFRDSVSVRNVEREYITCVETASGKLQTSLWDALVGQGYDFALVDLMEDALASSVSFYHAKRGDEFKLIYERKYIDERPISLGKLLGAYYKNERGEHYAIYFESDKYSGFFDQEARPSKKSFLLSPVKYSRISSPFSYSRFHPIKKRRIPHLGTDYAALQGTPIRTVADGVVIAASYTKANGKYVKIKHDKTYQTQYLHMSRFAKGIVPGATVLRGETIGYVGSTGLATGPHVCFRFWKNGRQVNHLRENFPPADPMPEEYLPAFYDKRDEIMNFLAHITIDQPRATAKTVSLNQPNT